jgi:ribosomal protein L11 methyltransferase
VIAIELDADAIPNAEANVARNDVAERVSVLHGDAETMLPLLGRFRVILVNIISSVITQLLPAMREALAPGGRVVLSGVLVAESDALKSVLAREGWSIQAEDVEGEWWSAIASRE